MAKVENDKSFSVEQKLKILEWLTSKIVISDIDAFENDALVSLPSKMFVQFSCVSELSDPLVVLWKAMQIDLENIKRELNRNEIHI